jgi:hypothetical protein
MICNFYERNFTVKFDPREKYYDFSPTQLPERFRIFALQDRLIDPLRQEPRFH